MQGRVFLWFLIAAALLASTATAASDDDGDQASPPESSVSPKGLRKVMLSSSLAIGKLRTTVKKYQQDEQLRDTRTQALLSDCMELTQDSKDVLEDSMTILVKLQSKSNKSSNDTGSGSSGGGDEVEELRTNLSAALTDITTCTDGLHDEITDVSVETKKAVSRIDRQAAKVSELLSKALSLTASIQSRN